MTPPLSKLPARLKSVRRPFDLRLLAIAILLAVNATPAVASGDTCPYLPDYRKLRAALPKLPAARAAVALDRYSSSHDNPEGCEAADIDRRLAAIENRQFELVGDGRSMAAHVVFRCNEWDTASGRCTGPMEDGTAQADGAAHMRPRRASGTPLLLVASCAGARLMAVYVTTLGDVLDGKPPLTRSTGTTVALPAQQAQGRVLMAIYETSGTWRYRKVVWYF